jgi:DNA-binding transcriptional ArsR family regulator
MTDTNRPNPAAAVLAALADRPEVTAAEAAEAAGVGRSTATKALASLAAEKKVRRVAGGREAGRRLPDRWSLAVRANGGPSRTERDGTPDGAARLAKGQLAELVLAHLRGHRGEHSPTGIANALGGRSAGAVGNALDRLVAAGQAVQTSAKPRRYQAAR